MDKISVVIITLNEERNIGRCLKSVKEVADDIVVLDSFSTDRTPEICRQHNVNFIQKEWEGYSATKNYANEQAKYDWILSLDADEALSVELRKSFMQAKKRDEPRYYQFNRKTNYCGQWINHSGWYPDVKFRSFDRRNTKWQGMIHEEPVMEKEFAVRHLKGDCLHYSFYSEEEHIAQAKKFAALKAKAMFKKGRSVSSLGKMFSPLFKFIRIYFLKLGFLDGAAGWKIANISARADRWKFEELERLKEETVNA